MSGIQADSGYLKTLQKCTKNSLVKRNTNCIKPLRLIYMNNANKTHISKVQSLYLCNTYRILTL